MSAGTKLKYADQIVTSPNSTIDDFPSPFPRPPITQDDDLSHEDHHPRPSTFPPDPPKNSAPRHGRYTIGESFRRRTQWGTPALKISNRSGTKERGTSLATKWRSARKHLPNLLRPKNEVGESPGFVQELRSILFGTWFNVLLFAIPVSWAFHFAKPNEDTPIFITSFLAIIPLANLLALAADELSIRVDEKLSGLLNATLGNAVELIIAIIALVKCELRIVQSSLVGSILSNLLFVLGLCFFAGGTRFSEQGFGLSATQLNSSLLTLSVIGVLIPAAFDQVAGNGQISGYDTATEQGDILKLSHGTAFVLLFIYILYLFFQLFSHKSLYDDTAEGKPVTVKYAPRTGPSPKERTKKFLERKNYLGFTQARGASGNVAPGSTDSGTPLARTSQDEEKQNTMETNERSGETPKLSLSMALGLMVVAIALVAVTAEWLVDSIDGLVSGGVISKEFIGLILLPIVGNVAEHISAVTESVKDKLSLSLAVAVGSSIQIALFVIPFTVILGWIIGHPATMLFDPFESIVLFFSVLTVNYVVQDGKSNWLEGMILICLYFIVAVVFWFYPGTEPTGLLACPA